MNAGCGAFADYLAIKKEECSLKNIERSLYAIQASIENLPGCEDFIISTSHHLDLNSWVQLYKTVLAKNEFPNTTIEACNNVKISLLKSMKNSLVLLSNEEKLNTEALDDIITSLTNTLNSHNENVLREGYLRLVEVFKLFKNKKSSDDSQMMDLYDAQFSIAIRRGLTVIPVAEEFLTTYLDFIVREKKKNEML